MGSVLSEVVSEPTKPEVVSEPTKPEEEMKDNNALRTDAIESSKPFFRNSKPLSFDQIKGIENDLSFYEKVSLVFLLYDQYDLALQSLLVEKENLKYNKTINVIQNLFRSKMSNNKEKMIEALCIIQNFQVLKKIGYTDKEALKNHFLPFNPYVHCYVNHIRKALYIFCESLNVEQIHSILSNISTEIKILDFDEIYLEAHLLQCFSRTLIKEDDMSNLINICKKMGLYSQVEMLQSVIDLNIKRKLELEDNELMKNLDIIENNKSHRNCDFQLNNCFNETKNSSTVNNDRSLVGKNSIIKTIKKGDCYKIDPENVGICLIINQKTFYREPDPKKNIWLPTEILEERLGTDVDKKRLSDTFKSLGFRIKTYDNLIDTQITKSIEDTMKTFTQKDSCFVVCILSHGIENYIYGVNSIPVEIIQIENIIHNTNYRNFLGKPKILILQSCQGKELQRVINNSNLSTDGPSVEMNVNNKRPKIIEHEMSGLVTVPQKTDFIICMSTVPGFKSIRHKEEGTWFIQEFCNVIDEDCNNNDFIGIATKVIAIVKAKVFERNKELLCMVPQMVVSVAHPIFLPKVQQSSSNF